MFCLVLGDDSDVFVLEEYGMWQGRSLYVRVTLHVRVWDQEQTTKEAGQGFIRVLIFDVDVSMGSNACRPNDTVCGFIGSQASVATREHTSLRGRPGQGKGQRVGVNHRIHNFSKRRVPGGICKTRLKTTCRFSGSSQSVEEDEASRTGSVQQCVS